MKTKKLAIVWPANPQAVNVPQEADPERHRDIANRLGAVYWDSMPKRRELPSLNGYIYINGAIRYKCKVLHVISREKLRSLRDERRYVPEFRSQCLEGRWPNGSDHPPSNTWIKISNVERLQDSLMIGSINKWTGDPLQRVQGGIVYIQDPFP